MDFAEIVGLLAGLLTTIAGLPQLYKIVRTRSTRDISLGMYILSFCGVVLWLGYGVMIGSLPIIAANAVTLLVTSAILVLKLRYG